MLSDRPGLVIAAINSDRDVTVSGPEPQLRSLAADMIAQDTVCTVLELDYAFHSAAMDPLREPLLRALEGLAPARGRVPLYSTVTGARIAGMDLDAAYWWRNVRRPVLFAAAVDSALDDGADLFVEIGPHPVLRSYLRRITADRPRTTTAVLPTLHRAADGPKDLATTRATLLAAGAATDWSRYFPQPGQVVGLPAYPWQRERHWGGGKELWTRNGPLDHPLLGAKVAAPMPLWSGAVEPVLVPWLTDHRVAGSVVIPATGFLEMLLAAGERALGTAVSVDRMDISSPLTIPWAEASAVHTQVALNPDDQVATITSTDEGAGEPRPHVRARVRRRIGGAPGPLDPAGLRARCTRRIAAADQYTALAEKGLAYGPAFQVLTELRVGSGEVLAAYRMSEPTQHFTAHPALLDGALQAGAPLLSRRLTAHDDAYLPSAFEAVHVWRTPAAEGLVHGAVPHRRRGLLGHHRHGRGRHGQRRTARLPAAPSPQPRARTRDPASHRAPRRPAHRHPGPAEPAARLPADRRRLRGAHCGTAPDRTAVAVRRGGGAVSGVLRRSDDGSHQSPSARSRRAVHTGGADRGRHAGEVPSPDEAGAAGPGAARSRHPYGAWPLGADVRRRAVVGSARHGIAGLSRVRQ
ncbi:acyltransferase domain-containing protein [Streptomyces sp. BP-8]|uniref:Acyltransferase domain-containing protein n=1 Tax=Streptomyces sirii TaxID=3127701 RepID=A0ABZ2QXY9_9ACTN